MPLPLCVHRYGAVRAGRIGNRIRGVVARLAVRACENGRLASVTVKSFVSAMVAQLPLPVTVNVSVTTLPASMAMDYTWRSTRSRCSACQLRCASKDGAVRERGIGYRIRRSLARLRIRTRKTVGDLVMVNIRVSTTLPCCRCP